VAGKGQARPQRAGPHAGRLAGGDTFYEAWLNLGVCLAHESIRLRFAGEPIAALIKLREARDCFAHALKLKSDFGKARRDLEVAEADLRQYGGLTGTENKK
jgi:hypothetical protein